MGRTARGPSPRVRADASGDRDATTLAGPVPRRRGGPRARGGVVGAEGPHRSGSTRRRSWRGRPRPTPGRWRRPGRPSRAAALRPEPGEAQYLLGAVEKAMGRPDAARAAWLAVPAGSPFALHAAMMLARGALVRDRHADAEPYLKAALGATMPTGKEAREVLLNLYKVQNRLEEARRLVRDGWETYPDRIGTLQQLWRLDSPSPILLEELRYVVENAAKNAPDDDRVWLARANLAARTSRYGEAAQLLEKCRRATAGRPDRLACPARPGPGHAGRRRGPRRPGAPPRRRPAAGGPPWRSAPGSPPAPGTSGPSAGRWSGSSRSPPAASPRSTASPGWPSRPATRPRPPACGAARPSWTGSSSGTGSASSSPTRRPRPRSWPATPSRSAACSRPVPGGSSRPAAASCRGRGSEAALERLARAEAARRRRRDPRRGPRRTRPCPRPDPAPGRPHVSTGPAPAFTDDAEAVGLRFRYDAGASKERQIPETMGTGLGLLDYDGDGWLDVYATQGVPVPSRPAPARQRRPPLPQPRRRHVRGRHRVRRDRRLPRRIRPRRRRRRHRQRRRPRPVHRPLAVLRPLPQPRRRHLRGRHRVRRPRRRPRLADLRRASPTSTATATSTSTSATTCDWDEASPFICHDPKFGANRLCNPGLFPSLPDRALPQRRRPVRRGHQGGRDRRRPRPRHGGRSPPTSTTTAGSTSSSPTTSPPTSSGGTSAAFGSRRSATPPAVAASGSGGYQAGMGVGCGDVDGDGLPRPGRHQLLRRGDDPLPEPRPGRLQRPVRRLRPARRHPRPPRLRDRLPRRQQRRPARPGPGQRPRRRLPARVPVRDALAVVPRGDRRPPDGRRRPRRPSVPDRAARAGPWPSATSTTTAASTSSSPASTPP